MTYILSLILGAIVSPFIVLSVFPFLINFILIFPKYSQFFKKIAVALLLFQSAIFIGQFTMPKYKEGILVKKVASSESKTPVWIKGKIVSSEISSDGSRALLETESFFEDEKEIKERVKIQCFLPIKPPLPGTIFKASLLLSLPKEKTNIGQFNQKRYLGWKGIYLYGELKDERLFTVIKKPLFHQCKNYRNFLRNKIIEECGDESGVVLSLLLGERNLLTQDEQLSLVRSGLFHLIALSGLHIGIVIWVLYFFFSLLKIHPLTSDILTLFFLPIYAILVKDQPSVLRAIFMASFFIIGKIFLRVGTPIRSIFISALVLLLINPFQIMDAGFQLTYLSTLGIILLYKIIPKIFKEGTFLDYIFKLLFISISAQLFTLPILIVSFQRVSLISFILTPIASIPLFPLLALGILFLSGFSLIPFVSSFLLILIKFFAKLFIFVPQFSSQFHFSSLFFPLPHFMYLIAFTIVIFFLVLPEMKKKTILTISLFLILIFAYLFPNPFEKSIKDSLIVSDIGQGNCSILILDKKVYLIDCGDTSYNSLPTSRGIIEPTLSHLRIKEIEGIFITHWDKDHSGSLKELTRDLKVNFVAFPECPQIEDEIKRFLIKNKVRMIKLKRGDSVMIENAVVNVEHPVCQGEPLSDNDLSLVLSMVINGRKILFTGDIEKEGERSLFENVNLDRVDILMVPHHGAKNALFKPFIEKLSPQFSVFSVGRYNRFGHPNKMVEEYYASLKTRILRTDKDGSLLFKLNSKKLVPYKYRDFQFDNEIKK